MAHHGPPTSAVIPPDGGDLLGFADGVQDRFLVEGHTSGGRLALVEHILAPRALAAPLHRHSREDEYTYVLEGDVGVRLSGDETVVGPGAVLVKPRGQWHTFWNAGGGTARVLEVIAPAGIEALFRTLDGLEDWPQPDELIRLAAQYGAEVDMEGTMPIAQEHGLTL